MKSLIVYLFISFILGMGFNYLYSLHLQTYQGKTAEEWAKVADSYKSSSDKSASSEATVQTFPNLDLPLEDFSNSNVQWGSVDNVKDEKITKYTQAAISNKAVYQSYPTLNTTIKYYSSDIKPLKILTPDQTKQEISKVIFYGQTRAEDSYRDFGTLVSNYLPEYYIMDLVKLDVDGDGVPEKIVRYNATMAAGGGSYQSDIIKGNNIIFSIDEDNAWITPADTTNGFYIEWGSINDPYAGRCCEQGFMRTRFVSKDGKFVPIYEQEVRYLMIGKE